MRKVFEYHISYELILKPGISYQYQQQFQLSFHYFSEFADYLLNFFGMKKRKASLKSSENIVKKFYQN